ncbi:MAG: sulfatase-like hydrolase/transferase, partial [Lentisphaeraceae bacterium]|nr:sulfatase-like hydrolase/transferase [Lentisphaeraceae bacterium]
AVCSPSRFGLLTGKYPLRKNFWGPTGVTQELTISLEDQTIASVAKSAGYKTAVIGKWHLGFGKGKTDWNKDLKPGPLEIGFDYYYGIPSVNSGPPFVYVENYKVVGYNPADPFVLGKKSVTKVMPEKGGYGGIGGADEAHKLYVDEYIGTELTKKAAGWIKKNKENPFLLYFATTNIHHPFTPHPKFVGSSECGLYGDFVHELDWMVGELMKTLDECGLKEKTMVIFTSDNGGMLHKTGQKAWKMGHRLNGDLLGFKFGAWEGGHRVPFIVRWPGQVPAGTKSDRLVSQIDIIATLGDLLGKPIESKDVDSISQLKEFKGETDKPLREELIITPNSPNHLFIRSGKWVYIPAKNSGGFQGKRPGDHLFAGAATQQFTGMVNSDIENNKVKADAPNAQLYDLESDPYQKVNVYNQYPEVVKKLQSRLDVWKQKIPEGKRLGWININRK